MSDKVTGTNIDAPRARDLLENVWRVLTELDSYVDFKTELEPGAMGIEDVASVNGTWQALALWLEEMDEAVTG